MKILANVNVLPKKTLAFHLPCFATCFPDLMMYSVHVSAQRLFSFFYCHMIVPWDGISRFVLPVPY